MKKIVVVYQPAAYHQDLYVFEDGNKTEFLQTTSENVKDTLFTILEKHGVKDVALVGPKQFLRGVINQFQEEEVLRYNHNDIKFTIV